MHQMKLKPSNFIQAVIFIHLFFISLIHLVNHSTVFTDADPYPKHRVLISADQWEEAPAIRASDLMGVAGNKQAYKYRITSYDRCSEGYKQGVLRDNNRW